MYAELGWSMTDTWIAVAVVEGEEMGGGRRRGRGDGWRSRLRGRGRQVAGRGEGPGAALKLASGRVARAEVEGGQGFRCRSIR